MQDAFASREATRGRSAISGERRRPDPGLASDEGLIRRIADSEDERALSALYDRYGGMVYAMGLRYLRDRSLAEDLVQDVFTSVWRKAETYDPAKASFMTWIYQIARNRATDLVRRRRVRPLTTDDDPLAHLPGSESTERVAENLDVAEALSQLSPIHQEVLVLAYFEGITQSEIARRMGTPLGTVKSRTTAALRAFSRLMSSPQENDDG